MIFGTLCAPPAVQKRICSRATVTHCPDAIERRYRWGRRQSALATILAVLSLSACGSSTNSGVQEGTIGFVPGFIGGAVAEEPRAVLAARDILSAGGTAADAAVALYFTLAVTKPAQAGLGGGGVCVLYSWRGKQAESLDFLPPIRPGEGVVPGNVRGMLALQAKYGRLRWELLVGTAERLARSGAATSR